MKLLGSAAFPKTLSIWALAFKNFESPLAERENNALILKFSQDLQHIGLYLEQTYSPSCWTSTPQKGVTSPKQSEIKS
jgi:hypothetical protein